MSDCLNSYQTEALNLRRAGYSVFPVGANKIPKVSWKERIQALPSEDQIIAEFREPAGIGRVNGAVSGNAYTIDFDIRDPVDLAEFDQCFQHNVTVDLGYDLVSSLTKISTPGPGIQYAYRVESPVGPSQKLARNKGVLNPKSGKFEDPGCHIESRGEGGYCLSPGSAAICHPRGGDNYRHIAGPSLAETPVLTIEEHDTLIANAKFLGIDGNGFRDTREMLASQEQPAQPQGSPSYSCPETRGDDDLPSWEEILLPHGFTKTETIDGTTYWKRSGSKNKHSASTNYQGSGLFYAWSPNCSSVLETGRGYSKRAVFTALNCGDLSTEAFKAAARILHDQGFGRKQDLSHVDISEALRTGERVRGFFGFESFEEFMSKREDPEYLCEDILSRGGGCILGGPQKSLKTGLSIDLGYSLATGTAFLGKFTCPKPVQVGIMTGESERAKLQRLLITRREADLEFLDGPPRKPLLFITNNLPDLSSDEHLVYLELEIQFHGLEVCVVDPMYLCAGSYADKTSNVATMGNMLRRIDEIMQRNNCTPILLHHTNRKSEPYQPLSLRDLSGAGFAEWARQWLLVTPRTDFDPETYQHRLWMVVGGSAGHAGQYAVDIREKDGDDWAWIVDVRTEGEEKRDYREQKAQAKEDTERAKAQEFSQHLREALTGVAETGATLRELKSIF
ncbi:MAG: AAA family ATPase, partial [Planctomycetaceae bacterium]|nr:AAA family ATPase [Planctomycetaceae bacterium]